MESNFYTAPAATLLEFSVPDVIAVSGPSIDLPIIPLPSGKNN